MHILIRHLTEVWYAKCDLAGSETGSTAIRLYKDIDEIGEGIFIGNTISPLSPSHLSDVYEAYISGWTNTLSSYEYGTTITGATHFGFVTNTDIEKQCVTDAY